MRKCDCELSYVCNCPSILADAIVAAGDVVAAATGAVVVDVSLLPEQVPLAPISAGKRQNITIRRGVNMGELRHNRRSAAPEITAQRTPSPTRERATAQIGRMQTARPSRRERPGHYKTRCGPGAC